ncbi:hypothetical protein MMEU_5028 [Mycobacterium marinum str. Europe]|nr:hypothetical protein MMEU_5028 [Mycobacterium marinum str. Europe]
MTPVHSRRRARLTPQRRGRYLQLPKPADGMSKSASGREWRVGHQLDRR